jgi:hypothetical protein
MRLIKFKLTAVLGFVGLAVACDNFLGVENTSNPDRPRILRNPSDVENLAAAQFQQIINATVGSIARTQTGMLTAAFENASGLANNGLGPRSGIPRGPIDNGRGNPYQSENFADFSILTSVARNAADVLGRARDPGFSLADDTTTARANKQRLFAWTHFVYGVALGYLSLVYDSAGVPTAEDQPGVTPPLEGYMAVNQKAIAALDSALTYATMAGTARLPGTWLFGPTGTDTTAAFLGRVIRSYRARLRAGVARNPTERGAVSWTSVIADATAGITADLRVNMNPALGWDYAWLSSALHFRDANWHQMTYYIIGMADVSGGYDAWLATPRNSRAPFLIVTPDLRFPQGADRPAQVAVGQGAPTGRRYFRNRNPGLDQAAVGWQASWYDHYRFRAFADAGRVGAFPIFTKAENDLLAAEGYIRTNNIPAAAALIDLTRTTAGLPALTGAVTSATDPVPGGASCVPRVPVGPNFTSTACGNIMEAMKWEKRMETAYTTYGAWFFDSRGWGDLPVGTALHWPVPNQELDARVLPIYNLGGVGQEGSAAASTYGFGNGNL